MKTRFSKNSILVVLGPGGVGKTTVSAALGIAAAQVSLDTAVITVDPARRLHDALGIRQLGAKPRSLDRQRLLAAGLDPQLKFAALALDVKRAWDDLIGRLLPDPEARRKILANSFYRNLTEHFAGAESYAAIEQLLVIHESQRFALEIVDTPPAEHVFDFIEAPSHLLRLLDSPTARWLARLNDAGQLPGFRIANRVGRLVLEQLESVVGARPLSSIADFFEAAAHARGRIANRMRAAEALLHSPNVKFVLVTTPAQDRLEEALQIAHRMKKERLPLHAIVVNRAINGCFPETAVAAAEEITSCLQEIEILRKQITAVRFGAGLNSMLDSVAERLREQREAFGRIAAFACGIPSAIRIVTLPEVENAIRDLRRLAHLAPYLSPLVC